MVSSEDKSLIKILCPYCQMIFEKHIEHSKKHGLFSVLIKNHPNSEDCPPFVTFIDDSGKQRGSQKIDNIEEDFTVNKELLENGRNRINEIKNLLRFYHLKAPRKEGRGFEYKIANVADRMFMSSKNYLTLIEYLTENNKSNIFGAITIEKETDFEGGLFVYGIYLGMVFTIFWKDQKSIQNKTLDDLKVYAMLTIEKLLDIYDLMDFFF